MFKVVTGMVFIGFLLVWLGLRVRPAPFSSFSQTSGTLETRPLPPNLPAPVRRFYREVYGDEIPLVQTAVISGRARLRIKGVTFPARFRFIHEAGQSYRHTIEATFFGAPVMKVSETYLDGKSRLELPFGVTENEPKVNQGANLALWSEAIWFPSLFLTDERVVWEAIDDVTALLAVPFGNVTERFVVRFDPETGFTRLLESMRYKESDSAEKTLWLNEVLAWDTVRGTKLPGRAALIWLDEGSPWAIFEAEAVVYNVAINE